MIADSKYTTGTTSNLNFYQTTFTDSNREEERLCAPLLLSVLADGQVSEHVADAKSGKNLEQL